MGSNMGCAADYPSLFDGLIILEIFENCSNPLTIVDISNQTKLSFSDTQKVCESLIKLGYLSKDHSSNRYSPTSKCLKLGLGYYNLSPLFKAAVPIITNLSAKVEENIILVGHYKYQLTHIFNMTTTNAVQPEFPGEHRNILYTAAGRSILSHLQAMDVVSLVFADQRTSLSRRTITDPKQLMLEIENAAAKGFAVINGERNEDLISIGAAILDDKGDPIAAIELEGPRSRLKWPKKRERLGSLIHNASERITSSLKK